MNSIFTLHHPLSDITSIDIFSPSRGAGGTLSYPVKINNCMAFFEMDDEGDWGISATHISFSSEVLRLVNTLISNEEEKRYKLKHTIKNASSTQI